MFIFKKSFLYNYTEIDLLPINDMMRKYNLEHSLDEIILLIIALLFEQRLEISV